MKPNKNLDRNFYSWHDFFILLKKDLEYVLTVPVTVYTQLIIHHSFVFTSYIIKKLPRIELTKPLYILSVMHSQFKFKNLYKKAAFGMSV